VVPALLLLLLPATSPPPPPPPLLSSVQQMFKKRHNQSMASSLSNSPGGTLSLTSVVASACGACACGGSVGFGVLTGGAVVVVFVGGDVVGLAVAT
jgi:hypothetical protein